MSRHYDLLAVGECMVELSAAESLGEAGTLRRSYGGDVLNALVTAARLGARTGFLSRVGDDPFGASMLKAWRDEGIDTKGARLEAGDNGVYFISVAADGEREFSYRRDGSPASRLSPEDLDEAQIAASEWLLLSGITQALSDSARETTLQAAHIGRRHGVRVAYDPNYRPRLWRERGGVAVARDAFNEIAVLADWVLPSHPADLLLAGDGSEAPLDSVRRFAACCHNVALKCGAGGVVLAADGVITQVAGQRVPQVVDSTGAGDAWNGAFLHHLARGAAPEQAARHANQVAAATLAHRGAIPPRR